MTTIYFYVHENRDDDTSSGEKFVMKRNFPPGGGLSVKIFLCNGPCVECFPAFFTNNAKLTSKQLLSGTLTSFPIISIDNKLNLIRNSTFLRCKYINCIINTYVG